MIKAPPKGVLLDTAQTNWERKEAFGSDDLSPEIIFYKGDVPLGSILSLRVDRNNILAIANLLTVPLGADKIIATFDVVGTPVTTNPATGEPWRRGEIGASGLGIEAIMSVSVTKDGQGEQISRQYFIDKGDIHWLDNGEHTTIGSDGVVMEALADAFNMPSIFFEEDASEEDHLLSLVMLLQVVALTIPGGMALALGADHELQAMLDVAFGEEGLANAVDTLGPLIPMLRIRYGLDD